ncbi:hypothetical protein [Hydrococcus rivularis]|uniref:hypothetical protein n=1 Tax=Hydrococcus rivularis TaxID=1616834 RepID=UPI001114DD50|nr:hypothetical protein [Hydrococcus rivularis]
MSVQSSRLAQTTAILLLTSLDSRIHILSCFSQKTLRAKNPGGDISDFLDAIIAADTRDIPTYKTVSSSVFD